MMPWVLKRLSEAIKKSHRRDLRVDFFRGVAQWFIFVDHIPGNWLGSFTLQNFLFCDAAEIFVFLSGYSAGQVYGSMMDRHQWRGVATSLVSRVRSLYNAHLLLFALILLEVVVFSRTIDLQSYLDESRLINFFHDPPKAIVRILALQFQPAFLDILPLYITLLLILIPALPLLRRPASLLGSSLLIYLVIRITDTNLPAWRDSTWFFNPLAWQLLFFIGCVLGCPQNNICLPRSRSLFSLAFVVVVVSSAGLLLSLKGSGAPELDLHVAFKKLASIDKTGLHPLRLITALALAYLAAYAVPKTSVWMRSRLATPFILLGQHGLPVFCAGIVFSVMGRFALEHTNIWSTQVLINLVGFVFLIMTALVSAASEVANLRPRLLEKPCLIGRDESDHFQTSLDEDVALAKLQASAATYRLTPRPNRGKKALTLKFCLKMITTQLRGW